jgi:hypothetical protein
MGEEKYAQVEEMRDTTTEEFLFMLSADSRLSEITLAITESKFP